MKKYILSILLLLGSLALYATETSEKVDMAIFVSPTCVHCKHFENEYLPVLQQQYQDSVNFILYDISKDNNNLRLQETAKKFGKTPAFPTAIIGDTYLIGYPHEIKT